jgi:hypothetical protein
LNPKLEVVLRIRLRINGATNGSIEFLVWGGIIISRIWLSIFVRIVKNLSTMMMRFCVCIAERALIVM